MLSSLWNQIVATDDDNDSSDDEEDLLPAIQTPYVPNASKRIDEDDIAADQLLSSFPAFGTIRRNAADVGGGVGVGAGGSGLDRGSGSGTVGGAVGGSSPASSTLTDIVESPSNTSSVIASEWENFSPRKNKGVGVGGRKRSVGGIADGDDESTISIDHAGYVNSMSLKNDEDRGLQSLNSVMLKEKNIGSGSGNNKDKEWSEEEMNIWCDDKSKKSRRKKNHKKDAQKDFQGGRRKKGHNHKENRKRVTRKGTNNRQNDDKEISVYWNADFRHRWIHGSMATVAAGAAGVATSASATTNTNQQQTNDDNTQKRNEKSITSFGIFNDDLNFITPINPTTIKLGKQFTFSFDETPTESSHSNTTASTDSSDEEDEEDGDAEGQGEEANGVETGTNRSLTTTSSIQTGNSIDDSTHQHDKIIKHYNHREHWMPDQLCKACYACEEKFTVFRRRHHCRLCGQVFCSRCSSFFVEIVENGSGSGSGSTSSKDVTTVATTSTTATGDLSFPNDKGKNPVSTTTTASTASSTIASVINYDQSSARIVSIRTCKMCYDQVSMSGPNGLLWYGGEMRRSRSDSRTVSGVDSTGGHINIDEQHSSSYSSLSQHLVGFQGGSSNEGDVKNIGEKREKAAEEQEGKKEEENNKNSSSNTVGLISKSFSSRFTRRFGRLAESAAREAQIGDTGYNDEETKLIGTGVKNPDNDSSVERDDTNDTKEKTVIEKVLRPPSIEREISDAVNEQTLFDEEKMLKDAYQKIGLAAANHLEKLGRQLLRTEAPLLLKEKKMVGVEGEKEYERWVNKLMMLATRCCAVVSPNVRAGDMLDICPYCKVKVVPGGSLNDSTFMSGIVFRKNVSHTKMAKTLTNPKIMLLQGSIEYTRTENRISTLETLLEQESRYLQILVTKITKMKPDVLMVGRSVSRKAQELLLETNIVLLQYVKQSLMERVSRQTGAKILSGTDDLMRQFDTTGLGRCRRFRLVSFRDDDIWNNRNDTESRELRQRKRIDAESMQSLIGHMDDKKIIESKLSTANLTNHQRQAVLAARLLGEIVHDGCDAVKSGIAKRGVSVTYCLIEGCPGELGCTVVLRGASRPALKQVKRLFRFIVNASYNLKLETSYLRARRAKLPEDFKLPSHPITSTSLCVKYDPPHNGRKVRPWNGDGRKERSLSGKITAFDHQSILISSLWMAGKTQCCPADVKGISYYSEQDMSLGQFLRDSCFKLIQCRNPKCLKSVLEHSLSFFHNDGLLNITMEEMDNPIPQSPNKNASDLNPSLDENSESNNKSNGPIATWTYCINCKKVVTPLTFLSEDTWKFSFGKFLEVFFYNKTVQLNSVEHKCSCGMQEASTLYFGCGNLAARFCYERIRPYGVFLRRYLPFDEDFHKKFTVLELNEIMVLSSELFDKFHKKIEQTGADTRQLFGSPVNKPEHLQSVLSQLNEMDKEVNRASIILKEKIVSVTNKYNAYNQGNISSYSETRSSAQEAFAYFPWQSRRYLFRLASAWNERLSSIGQALIAMKKLTEASLRTTSGGRSDIGIVQNPIAESDFDDVKDAMKRLKQLREFYAETLDISDITTESNDRKSSRRRRVDDNDDLEVGDEFGGETVGGKDDLTYNFSEEVDADVLASRQRYSKNEERKSRPKSPSSRRAKPPRRRSTSLNRPHRDPSHSSSKRSRSQSPSQINKSKSVTAGGAVKSALSRFFTRSNREDDPHIVDLGILGLGRPKMEAGVGGVVMPVYDDKPSTIIAHSLASADYASQFRRFAKAEAKGSSDDSRRRNKGNRDSTIEDYFAGSDSTHKGRSPSNSSRRSNQRKNNTTSNQSPGLDVKKGIEKRMRDRNKTHIKHTFRDYDEKENQIAKFVCTTFWATQFQAVRQAFLKESSSKNRQTLSYNNSTFGTNIIEKNFVKSLSASLNWAVSGGKSGASFSKTSDERFIVKCISRTELQMFLDCAPAYFNYLSKGFFHGLPSMLAKIVGVYQIGYHNRVTGKRTMDQVVVMQNIFYGRNISRVFDLKGSLRGRFAKHLSQNSEKNSSQSSQKRKKRSVTFGSDSDMSSDEEGEILPSYRDSDDEEGVTYSAGQDEPSGDETKPAVSTFLDGDFLEFTGGRPLPLTDKARADFHWSIHNDTYFLSVINVLDYSILVGIDEEKNELVVGIIDFMRQYDILKQMERVGKSIPMVVGSEAPTIIQPPLYKARFMNAMERYFMTVPSKWTTPELLIIQPGVRHQS